MNIQETVIELRNAVEEVLSDEYPCPSCVSLNAQAAGYVQALMDVQSNPNVSLDELMSAMLGEAA